MGDSIEEDIVLNETENDTIANVTGRGAATREGLVVAYTLMFTMALFPIFLGSLRSVKYHYGLWKKGIESSERIKIWDAAMFPFYASGSLFGLYLLFKYLPKEYVNLLVNGFFISVGVSALTRAGSVCLGYFVSVSAIPSLSSYTITLSKKQTAQNKEIKTIDFTVIDVFLFIGSVFIVAYHAWSKNWILNNVIGTAFCINAIEMISLDNIKVGCLLLGGLFLYDVFWVFGTDVMVTVAKSFDAPIKLIIPLDIPENGWDVSNFGMLGLGDIVIPGLFIALLCRFDSRHHPTKTRPYFYISFISYIVGLATTVIVMHVYNAAQPALLYLVPSCVGIPLLLAIVRGDIKPLLLYEDYPEVSKEKNADGKPNNMPPNEATPTTNSS